MIQKEGSIKGKGRAFNKWFVSNNGDTIVLIKSNKEEVLVNRGDVLFPYIRDLLSDRGTIAELRQTVRELSDSISVVLKSRDMHVQELIHLRRDLDAGFVSEDNKCGNSACEIRKRMEYITKKYGSVIP